MRALLDGKVATYNRVTNVVGGAAAGSWGIAVLGLLSGAFLQNFTVTAAGMTGFLVLGLAAARTQVMAGNAAMLSSDLDEWARILGQEASTPSAVPHGSAPTPITLAPFIRQEEPAPAYSR